MTIFSDSMLMTSDSSLSVRDLFDIQLWTGNATAGRNITFDIPPDMFWTKRQDTTASHIITDKDRGGNNYFSTDTALAAVTTANFVTGMSGNTMTIGSGAAVNGNAGTFVSWAFKKQPGFFDIVSYVGNVTNRTIAHNLGVEPAMIIVKNLDTASAPTAYHKFSAVNPGTMYREMNNNGAWATSSTRWNNTAATASVFSVGTASPTNGSGQNHVAYLFAHNPSGFIQGGTYVGNGSASGPTINLGWPPQYVFIKWLDGTGNWSVFDTARGLIAGADAILFANLNNAESSSDQIVATGTGFSITSNSAAVNSSSSNYIYLAIKAE